jgi:aminoglycoside phosphotransferase (APT) family kinase protein
VASLLETWLDSGRTVRFFDLPVGQRLMANAREDALGRRVITALEKVSFHPAIFHGDFAPWNIRVDQRTGEWVVLDWERGETAGPPAWDWFHFVIQNEILVRHTSTEALVERVAGLACSPAFRRYARLAGIEAWTRPLLLAYLLYCRVVLKQADGLKQIEMFLERLARDPNAMKLSTAPSSTPTSGQRGG